MGFNFCLFLAWILLFCIEVCISISIVFLLLLLRLLASVKEIQAFEVKLIKMRNNKFLKNPHSYPKFTKTSEYKREASNMVDNCIYCTSIIVTWIEQLNSLTNSLTTHKTPRLVSCWKMFMCLPGAENMRQSPWWL